VVQENRPELTCLYHLSDWFRKRACLARAEAGPLPERNVLPANALSRRVLAEKSINSAGISLVGLDGLSRKAGADFTGLGPLPRCYVRRNGTQLDVIS
jgi:hypothetical protein